MDQREAKPKVIVKTLYLDNSNRQMGAIALIRLIQEEEYFIDSAQPLGDGIFYVLLKPNLEEDEPWRG